MLWGEASVCSAQFCCAQKLYHAFFKHFFDGIEHALKTYAVSLIGGDISASDRIMLSATAIGSAGTVVKRRGAR